MFFVTEGELCEDLDHNRQPASPMCVTDVNIQERIVDFALDSHGCQGSLVRGNLLRPARVTESTLAGACSNWLLVPAL